MNPPSTLLADPAALAPAAPRAAASTGRASGWLFHPAVDFLCLGGGSLLILLLLAVVPVPESSGALVLTVILLANLINHPHFAHSYQIFYRGFRSKAFGASYPRPLRLRYIVAGLVVPVALAVFFAFAFATANATVLGYGLNFMLFLVGWHYVKQGYGMIVVASVKKRQFFTEAEKRILRINALVCWIASWLFINQALSDYDMWGVKSFMFPVPGAAMAVATAGMAASTACLLYMLGRKAIVQRGRVPLNGILAYVASVYVWLFVRWLDPIAALIVPTFHSLQYLVIVWRYQLNYEKSRAAGAPPTPRAGWRARLAPAPFARFLLVGFALGVVGFWGLPYALEAMVAYDRAAFGGYVFLFMFWIFINVHHYFLDNVMWRRDNPDVRAHLFG